MVVKYIKINKPIIIAGRNHSPPAGAEFAVCACA
jgi:hypothetical protein